MLFDEIAVLGGLIPARSAVATATTTAAATTSATTAAIAARAAIAAAPAIMARAAVTFIALTAAGGGADVCTEGAACGRVPVHLIAGALLVVQRLVDRPLRDDDEAGVVVVEEVQPDVLRRQPRAAAALPLRAIGPHVVVDDELRAPVEHVGQADGAVRADQRVVRELDHRVKNILANVSAIARLSSRRLSTVDEFVRALDARIQAIARAHSMLRDDNWTGISLQAYLSELLDPFVAAKTTNIVFQGEEIWLKPKAAQSLVLVFHELATNAAKYGALATPEGKIKVSWSRNREAGRDGVTLVWIPQSSVPSLFTPRSS